MTDAAVVRGAAYFPVADIAAVDPYYRDVLGFRCEYAAGNPPGFAIYSRGGAALMFRVVADPTLIRPNAVQGGTWDLFCWVSDVTGLFLELERKGALVVYPPTVQPYGMKEFAVADPNGYVIGFGQEWPAAAAAKGRNA